MEVIGYWSNSTVLERFISYNGTEIIFQKDTAFLSSWVICSFASPNSKFVSQT